MTFSRPETRGQHWSLRRLRIWFCGCRRSSVSRNCRSILRMRLLPLTSGIRCTGRKRTRTVIISTAGISPPTGSYGIPGVGAAIRACHVSAAGYMDRFSDRSKHFEVYAPDAGKRNRRLIGRSLFLQVCISGSRCCAKKDADVRIGVLFQCFQL